MPDGWNAINRPDPRYVGFDERYEPDERYPIVIPRQSADPQFRWKSPLPADTYQEHSLAEAWKDMNERGEMQRKADRSDRSEELDRPAAGHSSDQRDRPAAGESAPTYQDLLVQLASAALAKHEKAARAERAAEQERAAQAEQARWEAEHARREAEQRRRAAEEAAEAARRDKSARARYSDAKAKLQEAERQAAAAHAKEESAWRKTTKQRWFEEEINRRVEASHWKEVMYDATGDFLYHRGD
jgi:flagellar biosynthesis GTPase FlhF